MSAPSHSPSASAEPAHPDREVEVPSREAPLPLPTAVSSGGSASEPATLTLRIPLEGPFKLHKELLLREFERAYFTRLLERCGGNVARSAREAGLDRKHLYSILHRHGLL